jgi:hypothetical protein
LRKYESFAALTQYNIVPFVLSHLGVIAKETRQCVAHWKSASPDPDYMRNLFLNVQFAIVNSQYHMFEYLVNTKKKEVLSSLSVKR